MEGQIQFLAPGVCHVDLAGESRRGPRVSLKASATALNSGPRGPGEGGPSRGACRASGAAARTSSSQRCFEDRTVVVDPAATPPDIAHGEEAHLSTCAQVA